jgi:hypothetical protein
MTVKCRLGDLVISLVMRDVGFMANIGSLQGNITAFI